HPDMLDRARAVDLAERESLPRLDDDEGVDLPTLPQIAGLARGYALGRHPTLAFLAGEIFRADGSRLRIRDAIGVAQAFGQSIVCAILRQRRQRRAKKQPEYNENF